MSNFIQYYEYFKLASAAYIDLTSLNEEAIIGKAEESKFL